MSRIQLDREHIELHLLRFIDNLLILPEVAGVKCCDILIRNDVHKEANVTKALDAGYHDCYSDADITVMVKLPRNSSMTLGEYTGHPGRFGITPDRYLGFLWIPDAGVYRVVFKDGIRYDLVFEFVYNDACQEICLADEGERYSNPQWPVEKIDAFWFVMIQALGKLYRRDYLISTHLANMNLNETLVQQMVLRDMAHGTKHHRYGYSEEIVYHKHLGRRRFVTGDDRFDRIADQLYAAALASDELTKQFYPEYKARSTDFFAIWQYYEHCRSEK